MMLLPFAAAAAASAFNLVCVGTQDMSYQGIFARQTKTVTEIFSIDLDTRRFCVDGCEQTLPIVAISDTDIVLQREVKAKEEASFERTVNRESGAMYSRSEVTGIVTVTNSKCHPALFSGFPAKKF